MTRIGIFGGSFDPIHNGHLHIAREAKEQYSLHQVFFVPAWISPHKQEILYESATPEQRYQLVELALAEEPGLEPCRIEIDQVEVSYTVNTLRTFKEQYPDAELYFMMGMDSYQSLSTWKDPVGIQQLAELIVAPREGDGDLEKTPGVHYLQMEKMPFSSSEVRDRLIAGQAVSEMVPSAVEFQIHEWGLYRKRKCA